MPAKPALTPLTVQPNLHIHVRANETQTITVSGGAQPIFVVPVEAGIIPAPKPPGAKGMDIDLKLAPGIKLGRVLITDMQGEEAIVTLDLVQ